MGPHQGWRENCQGHVNGKEPEGGRGEKHHAKQPGAEKNLCGHECADQRQHGCDQAKGAFTHPRFLRSTCHRALVGLHRRPPTNDEEERHDLEKPRQNEATGDEMKRVSRVGTVAIPPDSREDPMPQHHHHERHGTDEREQGVGCVVDLDGRNGGAAGCQQGSCHASIVGNAVWRAHPVIPPETPGEARRSDLTRPNSVAATIRRDGPPLQLHAKF